ncbi:hypothetical protein AB4Y90_12640 [Chryseobacterium sp. 2TAF14]|uniref:hypothetical protein n=1 Tax=Chryseobacterium sp. 2TAF14 TaxID=3233007 RepID=UPI003F90CBC7
MERHPFVERSGAKDTAESGKKLLRKNYCRKKPLEVRGFNGLYFKKLQQQS